MVRLDLTEDERDLLTSVLEEELPDLRVQIVDTDRIDVKEALRSRKEVLSGVLEKLRQAAPEEPAAA